MLTEPTIKTRRSIQAFQETVDEKKELVSIFKSFRLSSWQYQEGSLTSIPHASKRLELVALIDSDLGTNTIPSLKKFRSRIELIRREPISKFPM